MEITNLKALSVLFMSLGTFVAVGFCDESQKVERTFSVSGVPLLSVKNLSSDLKLIAGKSGNIVVRIEGTDAEAVKFEQKVNEVAIDGHGAGGRNVISVKTPGGTTVIESGPSSGSQRIIVDGKEIDPEGGGTKESAPYLPLKVTVEVPKWTHLKADRTKNVSADAPLGNVELSLSGISRDSKFESVENLNFHGSGQVSVEVSRAVSVDADLSGISKLTVRKVDKGSLKGELGGTSEVKASGSFTSVDIKASGSAKVSIAGDVSGDFKADLSGLSSIEHRGKVAGNKQEHTSGLAKVVRE